MESGMASGTGSWGRRVRWMAAVAAVAAGVGCGGGEREAPTVEEAMAMSEEEAAEAAREVRDLASVEACGLLTAAEVEAAVGEAPGAPEDVSQVGGQLPMCNWPAADGSGRVLVSLLVTRGGQSSYDEFIESSREQAGEMGMEFDPADWQHVPGIGDFGVWLDEEAAGGMLQVYQGGLMVQVDPEPAAGRDELEAAKELAGKAMGRLR